MTTKRPWGRGKPVHGHGWPPSPEYRCWLDIKTRCFNKDHDSYQYYGARGITICDRWLNSFENFLADVGLRPSPKHSIDRYPDNNGNYEPRNCRWATRSQQMRNRRPVRPPAQKLTEDQVREIKRDKRVQRLIAETYGISQGTVSDIKTGRCWTHVKY